VTIHSDFHESVKCLYLKLDNNYKWAQDLNDFFHYYSRDQKRCQLHGG